MLNYQKSNIAKANQLYHPHPQLPATYIALYPYKPQKPDELELKKGCTYFPDKTPTKNTNAIFIFQQFITSPNAARMAGLRARIGSKSLAYSPETM